MRFTLTIKLGNDAMQTGEDIAYALRIAADQVESSFDGHTPDSGRMWDVNGNRVGEWSVEL